MKVYKLRILFIHLSLAIIICQLWTTDTTAKDMDTQLGLMKKIYTKQIL